MPQVNEFAALVDARTFGAQGDGVNDDGPKIQKAINFLKAFGGIQGSSCYLPPGRYLIITPVVIPDGITISGAGDDTVILLGPDTATANLNAFTVADGDTAGFANLQVQGPSVPGGFTVRFVDKLGTTGAVVLSSITSINAANAPVRVAVGSRFVLENCSEVAEDYYPVAGAAASLTHAGDALWTGGNWPRRIKGTDNPSAGAGVPASEGSTYQRFVAGSGQLWIKTGAADTAWSLTAAGGGTTLQGAYDNGPPVTITLDPILGGVGILDSAPAQGAGNPLLRVSNNADTVDYWSVEVDAALAYTRMHVGANVGSTKEIVFDHNGSAAAIYTATPTVAGTTADTLEVLTGTGANGAGVTNAGNGGIMLLASGPGGDTTAATNLAGNGGLLLVAAGQGGTGGAAVAAGNGGQLSLSSGTAGVAVATGGAGGALNISVGASSGVVAGSDMTLSAGNPGAVASQAGNIILQSAGGGALPGMIKARVVSSILNAVVDVLLIHHDPSAGAAAGSGAGVRFLGADSAGADSILGRLEYAFSDATAASEDSVFRVYTRVAGAASALTASFVGGAAARNAIVPSAYSIGTEATNEWSVQVAANVATYTVADTTFTHAFTQTTVATPGARSFFTVTGARNTNQTASTEVNGIRLNMSAGREWAAGAIVAQREVMIDAPTYDFVGPSTVTTAATLYAAAPIAGVNATLTNTVAGWLERASALTATVADVLLLEHSTSGAAAAGFGVGLLTRLEDGAGTAVIASRMATTWIDATAGSTNSYVTFSANANGVLVEVARFGSSGAASASAQVLGPDGTAALPGFAFISDPDTGMYNVGADQLGFATGGVVRARMTGTEFFYTQTATAAGTPDDVQFVFAAHTNVTASTEVFDLNVDTTRTVTWNTGNFALERSVNIGQPTWNANAGSTITRGVNVNIVGAPNMGANMITTDLRAMSVGGNVTAGASAAATTYSVIDVPAHTVTYTNTTAQTGVASAGAVRVGQVTYAQNTGGGTLTIASAASLVISGPPIAGTGTALTETLSLLSANGLNRLQFEDATTATTVPILTLQRTTSGGAAANIGVSTSYVLENSAGTATAAGALSMLFRTATAASEDSDMVMTLMDAGAAATERYRFGSRILSFTPPAAQNITLKNLQTTGIIIQGNYSAAGGNVDVVVSSSTGRTSGSLFQTQRNLSYQGVDVAFYGGTKIQCTTLTRTAAQAYGFKVDWLGPTSISDNNEAKIIDITTGGASILTATATTLALNRMYHFGQLNVTSSGTLNKTITDLIGIQIDTPTTTVVGGSTGVLTMTNLHAMRMGVSVAIGPSGTATNYSIFNMAAHTITYTVATGSTQACGVAGLRLDQITVAQNTGAGTLTVTNAATLYISNAPVAGTGSAIINQYAVFVDAGLSRFDGDGTNVFELPNDATVDVTAVQIGRVPVKINGVNVYLHTFDK
jgi:hypothetical protein